MLSYACVLTHVITRITPSSPPEKNPVVGPNHLDESKFGFRDLGSQTVELGLRVSGFRAEGLGFRV